VLKRQSPDNAGERIRLSCGRQIWGPESRPEKADLGFGCAMAGTIQRIVGAGF